MYGVECARCKKSVWEVCEMSVCVKRAYVVLIDDSLEGSVSQDVLESREREEVTLEHPLILHLVQLVRTRLVYGLCGYGSFLGPIDN